MKGMSFTVWTENKSKVLTVAELRAMLQRAPDDAMVYCEGCDCTGEAGGIDYDDSTHSVEVRRSRW